MSENLVELWKGRYLLRQLVVRELKIRYTNSVLGFVWSIVPPILEVLVYTFLFRTILGQNVPNYSAYALCGIIPWAFLNTSVMDASQSLLENYSVIRKVYLPREDSPLAIVLSNFIHFLIAWALYFLAFFGVARLLGIVLPIRLEILWFPVITLVLFCFTTGVALWVCALNVFFTDVKFIMQTVFRLGFFVVPIIFPADNFYYTTTVKAHPFVFTLYMLNPITACIEAYRKALLQPVPREAIHGLPPHTQPLAMNWATFAGAGAISVFTLWAGYAYFNWRKWQFVERS